MNETIGVKGGQNDRRRSLIIKNEQYKKLLEHKKQQEEKQLRELEKELKISQVKTIVTAVPLVIAGTFLKELTSPKKEEEITIKEDVGNNEPIKVAITTKRYGKVQEQERVKKEIIEPNKIEEKQIQMNNIVESVEQNVIPLPSTEITPEQRLEDLKEYEIINRYESKLKEIKIDLKKLIYEYNVIAKDYDEVYESKAVEELLDKLNTIIKKMDELKGMLEIPNKEDYDQNYIYDLINQYLTDFSQNKVVEDIKDSELYILISSKLEELDQKKEKLKQDLSTKKEAISLDEEHLEELKERYDAFDNFNNSLLRIQVDQEALIRELDQKIKSAVTEQEKVETKIRFLQNQSSLILNLMKPQLLIPGAKSTTKLALATICLARAMKNNFRPTVETKHYKVINVSDYTKDITNSLQDIDRSLSLLKKSKKQLQLLIEELKKDYKVYFGQVKECDQLLENLQDCLFSLEEKEEEMQRLKLEQEKNLEHNNEKIKLMNKYEII